MKKLKVLYCGYQCLGQTGVCVISYHILFAQNSTRNLKQSQVDNELDGQGSNGALTAT